MTTRHPLILLDEILGRPRLRPRRRASTFARIAMTLTMTTALTVASMLVAPTAHAEVRYVDSAAEIDKAYDAASKNLGSNPSGDGADRLRTLDRLRIKLKPMAATLDDRAGRLDSMRSKSDFLKREVESAERESKRIEDTHQAECSPLIEEINALNAACVAHNAAKHLFTDEEKGEWAAYDAEAADLTAKLEAYRLKATAFDERWAKLRADAKDILVLKQKDFSEHHDKFTDLLDKQNDEVEAYSRMLAEANGASQGLGTGGAAPAAAPPARPAPAAPKEETQAMKDLRGAAGHGEQAIADTATEARAHERASKVFDDRGDKGVMADASVVVAPAMSGQDPVVPPDRQTPVTDRLVKELRSARQEEAKAEQVVAELKQQPQSGKRDMAIVEGKIKASKARNAGHMVRFHLDEEIAKPPEVHPETKGK